MLVISISSAGVGAISPRFFGIWHRLVIVRQAPGPREVHLALGVIRRGVDLGSPDGLYAGRDRLQKSATDMATAERRLSQIKYWLSLIHISEPTRRTPISYAVFCLKK